MKSVLIGYGYWGKIIKRYIEGNNYFELVGVCDPALENSLNLEDILKSKDIECAFVCSPVDTHYSTVKKLLEHNKHVFCEKPLCKDFNETKELVNLSEKKEVCLYTDYIYTVSPSINFIKENINLVGKVLYCEASIKQFGNFYQNDDVFEVIGVHMFSALSYILDAEIAIKNILFEKKNKNNLTEIALIEFEMLNNIKGIINCSLLNEVKERKIKFICEKGIIIFDMLGEKTVHIEKYSVSGNGYDKEILISKKYDEMNNIKKVLEDFINYMEKGKGNNKITYNVSKVLYDIQKKSYNIK
jgi:oxidoreductase, gfo/idh/mocA family/transferase hexapeptide repeat protein